MGHGNTRRMALVLAVATAAALALPSTANAAAASAKFESGRVQVQDRNGRAWDLSVTAERFGGTQPYVALALTLERSRNPDGSGLLLGRQTHTWNFGLPGSTMTVSDDLASGSLDTGGSMGDRGRIAIDFDGDGPLEGSCGGHNANRKVSITGSSRFATERSLFGTLSERPSGGQLTRSDGQCYPSVTECPAAGHTLSGAVVMPNGFRSFFTHVDPDGDRATRNWNLVRYPVDGGPRITSTVTEEVGGGSVDVAGDLTEAQLRGVAKLYTTGTLSLSGGGGYDETAWANCGADRRFHLRTLRGWADGDLVADHHGFPNWVTPDGGLSASLREVIVEPR